MGAGTARAVSFNGTGRERDKGGKAMVQGRLFGEEPAAGAEAAPAFANLAAAREAARGCVRCDLSRTRRQVVFGEGAPQARLLILGEGPSEMDDRSGSPFSGPSGRLLETWFNRLGLRRGDVWLTNVVRCRPAAPTNGRLKNRPPTDAEAGACRLWLETEIGLVRPVVILALGGSAGKALLGKGFKITQERGKWHAGPHGAAILTTFHPAYLLRLEGAVLAQAEATVDADLDAVKARLQERASSA
jgi:DNA polymerase